MFYEFHSSLRDILKEARQVNSLMECEILFHVFAIKATVYRFSVVESLEFGITSL